MALTKAQKRLLDAAREVGREPGQGGKYLGRELSSLIGELAACEELDLRWEPSTGYDACSGKDRVQIKTRKSESTPEVNPKGRIGRVGHSKPYSFDVAVYVELDDKFNVSGIWRMPVDEVEALEEQKDKGNRGLHVSTFRSRAEKIE